MSTELRIASSSVFVLTGARLLDPAAGLDRRADILVEEGRIARIAEELKTEDSRTYDLGGLTLVPGFIDLRARFGEPGREERETVDSGLSAAASGGYVAVCLLPDCEPVVDNQAMVQFLLERAEGHPTTLLPLGAVSRGMRGERLADLGELARAGVAGFSEGDRGLESAALLRGALAYSKMFGLPLFELPQEHSLREGEVHEGLVSLRMGLAGIPRLAEELGVFRGLRCAAFEDAGLHLQLLSTRESLELLRQARESGLRVTADCGAQHLALTDEAVAGFDPSCKLFPPLRPAEDRLALAEAAARGLLDAVCSDHRPAEFDDLDREFGYCPFGCSSLETAFAAAHLALVEGGHCELSRLLELFSSGPRRVLGLPPCPLEEGQPAELSILDLECRWTYRGAEAATLGINSPWEGREFSVRPAGVVNGPQLALRS